MQHLQKQSNEISTLPTGKNLVVKAFQQPKIFASSDDEIKNVLKYIFALVGLREYPTEVRKQVLFDYIKTNYASYSLEEIKVAFKLALKNEFVCEIKHYEMFSPSYFSGVFEAYIEYRSRIAKEFMKEQQKELDKPKEPTKEEILQLKKDFFNQVLVPLFEKYKVNKKLESGLTPIRIVYESLKEHGVIELTKDEENEIKQSFKNVRPVNNNEGLDKFIGTKKTPNERYRDYCQKRAIEISFNKKINRNEKLKFEL